MAEPIRHHLSPLDGLARPGRRGRQSGVARVTACEIEAGTIVGIIARNAATDTLAAAVHSKLAVDLPLTPCRAASRDVAIVWSGPGRWLAMSNLSLSATFPSFTEALAGTASVIDQSHALALVRLEGPRARDALAKGFPIDLHPRAFEPGQTAVTSVAHIPAQIWQTRSGVYEIAVARSLAQSFWRWLEVSSADYGLEVRAPAPVLSVD
jgi:sarcosine oxidase subunit gamma